MFYLNLFLFFSFSRNFTIREFEQALSEPVFVVGWDVGWVGGWLGRGARRDLRIADCRLDTTTAIGARSNGKQCKQCRSNF